jgi:protein transport protein SEC31
MGIIAGGMDNGSINIYNPEKILKGLNDAALLASIEGNNGAITALQFNPHQGNENLLATGSSKGEILITSLENPAQPTVTVPSSTTAPSGAEITQMAWNPEVPHIVASAAGNGVVIIWDLKQNKPWCELRCEVSGAPVSDVAWNPINGMHLITASADDRSPVMKLWDLRASMSMPLATLEGHTQGILSMSWCPHDDSLLVSSGKDNKTYLWDIQTLKPVTEIPNDDPLSVGSNADRTSSDLYGTSGLSSSQQKRYDIKWSPIRRGIISTCSFDRKVQIHSVVGSADKCGRPPKWMKPSSGVSCGFGGTVVKFGCQNTFVTIDTHIEEPDVKAIAQEFENSISQGDFAGYAKEKSSNAGYQKDVYEEQLWGFMSLLFEPNTKSKLLEFLGFEPSVIATKANEYQMGESEPAVQRGTPKMPLDAEVVVNNALLVGNFDAAVECCIRVGNFADALVLASCGGAELWAKTQARYFESETRKRPYLSLVSAIIQGQLSDFVAGSDVKKWRETLAVLCTYANQDEFTSLCSALADHLEMAGNHADASLCYMCAFNLEKAARYWLMQLSKAEEYDHVALHNFAVKVAIFLQTGSRNHTLSEETSQILFQYAKILADQGLFPAAAKYCKSQSQECRELSDRLYRSKDSQLCTQALGYAPEFPYNYTNVGVAPKPKSTTSNAAVSSSTQRSMGPSAYSRAQAQTTLQSSQINTGQSQQYMTTQQQQNYGQQPHVYNEQASVQYNPVQQQHGAQYSQSTPTTTTDSSQLPHGWIVLQDPSSGRPYYANSSTGETTWDKPAFPSNTMPSQPKVGTALASKYGDGFVTSASHPELAAQYGNVGTSNPYTDSARPGTAVFNRIQKSPVSGTFNLQKLAQIADSIEYKSLVEDLLSTVTSLSAANFSSSDKKLIVESEKGVAIFSKRLANADIEKDIADKMEQIVDMMKKGDYITATTVHTKLVNSVWKEHKDWLKGIKFLIQLKSKMMQSSMSSDPWAQ